MLHFASLYDSKIITVQLQLKNVFGSNARRLRCRPDSTSRTSPGEGASHLELPRGHRSHSPRPSLRRRRWRSTRWYIAQRQLTPLNKGGLDMSAATLSILSLITSVQAESPLWTYKITRTRE